MPNPCFTSEQKAAMMQKLEERALFYEREYGNCPQCTLEAVQDIFGGVEDSVFQASFGFGAGTGLTAKGTCGALNAAVMLISIVYGRSRQEFSGSINPKCTELVRRVLQRFEEKYDGIRCKDVQLKIMGDYFDLTVPEEREAYLAAGGHVDKCPYVVSFAASLIAELIFEGELPLNAAVFDLDATKM